jgi:hypothetical protein
MLSEPCSGNLPRISNLFPGRLNAILPRESQLRLGVWIPSHLTLDLSSPKAFAQLERREVWFTPLPRPTISGKVMKEQSTFFPIPSKRADLDAYHLVHQ